MKIRPVGAELFHVVGQRDRQTDKHTHRHDEAHSHFSRFREAPKTDMLYRFSWVFLLSRSKFVRSAVRVKDSRLKLCQTYRKMVVCARKIFVLWQPLWCDESCGSSLLAHIRATHNRWSHSSNLSIPVRTLHSYFCDPLWARSPSDEKRLLDSCPSAYVSAAPTGRIHLEFDMGACMKICRDNPNLVNTRGIRKLKNVLPLKKMQVLSTIVLMLDVITS
jgi:hypothetical protein